MTTTIAVTVATPANAPCAPRADASAIGRRSSPAAVERRTRSIDDVTACPQRIIGAIAKTG